MLVIISLSDPVFCQGVKYWGVAQTWQPISYNVIYGPIALLYPPIVIHRVANSENRRKIASFQVRQQSPFG